MIAEHIPKSLQGEPYLNGFLTGRRVEQLPD